jgi:SSS family solute:Na+ symporter
VEHISLLDWAICLAYLGLIIGLGLYFSNKQKDNEEFFFGGGKMHWLPVGLSLFATTFSSNSFVGLPAEGAFGDYHQLLAILFIPFVVIPIVCIWFIPFYKGLGLISLYEYLERRFARPVRLAASVIFMVYSAGWMGTMLLAVSRILNVVLESQSTSQTIIVIVSVGFLATIYTAMGGVKAVIWTDTIQAFALCGGMIFLFLLLLDKIDGGWSTFVATGSEAGKFEMFRTDGGMGVRNVYSACVYGFFIYLGAQVASYGAFQRYVTVDTVGDARRALIVKGAFTLISCTLFFLVGTALFVYYQQSHVEVFQQFSEGRSKDQLLPHFVIHFAGGSGMTGLILAGLFAAAMSSLDSGINSMTATLVTDWLNGREVGTRANRFLTLAFGAGVTAIACLLSLIDSPVFDILLSIAGATLGLLLAVMLMGMLTPRTNTFGVICGMLTGLLVFGLIRMVLPQLDSATLEKLGPLAGLKDNTWWDGLFATMPAVVVGVLASLLRPPPGEDQLRGLLLRPACEANGAAN